LRAGLFDGVNLLTKMELWVTNRVIVGRAQHGRARWKNSGSFQDSNLEGDQPRAIEGLVEGVENGLKHQTLRRGYRLRQDLYYRECYRGDAEDFPGHRPQQDPGGATLQ